MAYADINFYKNTYKGSIIPDANFEVLAVRATAYLDKLQRVYTVAEAVQDGLKCACCSAADVMYQYAKRGDIVSQTVGGTSFTRKEPKPIEQELLSTVRYYLDVYRGG